MRFWGWEVFSIGVNVYDYVVEEKSFIFVRYL